MPKTRTKTPKPAARVYRAASYARLSVDDESYGTSGSVLNQHAMIRDFADANSGLSIVAEYSDDGFSGSTFENRPGWGSLLADVEAGKVDCIVVKDLSRLGRNYLDVSRYLDQVFPALGVRVVAITDGYDSAAEKTAADALLLPVKNLFNDMSAATPPPRPRRRFPPSAAAASSWAPSPPTATPRGRAPTAAGS